MEGSAELNNVPLEVLFEIANNMDCATLTNWCSTNKTYQSLLCDNVNFWKQYLNYRGYDDSLVGPSFQTAGDYKAICRFRESTKYLKRQTYGAIGKYYEHREKKVFNIGEIIATSKFKIQNYLGQNPVSGDFIMSDIHFTIALSKSGKIYSHYEYDRNKPNNENVSIIVKDSENKSLSSEEMPQFKWIMSNLACDINNDVYVTKDYYQSTEDVKYIVPIYKPLFSRMFDIVNITTCGYSNRDKFILTDNYGNFYYYDNNQREDGGASFECKRIGNKSMFTEMTVLPRSRSETPTSYEIVRVVGLTPDGKLHIYYDYSGEFQNSFHNGIEIINSDPFVSKTTDIIKPYIEILSFDFRVVKILNNVPKIGYDLDIYINEDYANKDDTLSIVDEYGRVFFDLNNKINQDTLYNINMGIFNYIPFNTLDDSSAIPTYYGNHIFTVNPDHVPYISEIYKHIAFPISHIIYILRNGFLFFCYTDTKETHLIDTGVSSVSLVRPTEFNVYMARDIEYIGIWDNMPVSNYPKEIELPGEKNLISNDTEHVDIVKILLNSNIEDYIRNYQSN